MPTNDVPGMHCVEQVLQAAPKGLEIILMGYMNARLGHPCDEHEKHSATELADRGLVNTTYHFQPRRQ